MSCPTENTVEGFLEGRLTRSGVIAVEAHARSCEMCADLIAAGLAAQAGSRSAVVGARVGSGPLTPGTSVGRYTVLALIGQGGMGEVYAAYDPRLDRRIALKLLRSDNAGGDARRESRLVREARAIARLSHPNVIAVHDVGTIGDRTFIAMEYIDGCTLSRWLAVGGRTQSEILTVFRKAADGLTAAHAAGLVHRDFKPQNVMVTSDNVVRVTDFGLARQVRSDDSPVSVEPAAPNEKPGVDASLTTTGEVVGTPLYMSPEQFEGKPTDARTDQFSFCVALYSALYGEHPFFSGTAANLKADVIAGRVRPPPARSTVPPRLRRTLLRGLAAEPSARWSSMDELAAALTRDRVRGTRLALYMGAIGLAAVSTIMALGRSGGSPTALCRAGPSRLADVWEPSGDGARRHSVHQAFTETGLSFAEETWRRVAHILDQYARGWVEQYTDACEGTHIRGDQSAEVLDLRMACLEGPRTALRALVDVFGRSDRGVLVQAVAAAQALPPLERCTNVPFLRTTGAPPSDPSSRQRLAAIRTGLADVKALSDTGQWAGARQKVAPVVAAARELRNSAALAEALQALGWLQEFSGESAAAAHTLEDALWEAVQGRRDDIAVECAGSLAAIAGTRLADHGQSDRWIRMGHALLSRLGVGQERAAAALHHGRGNAKYGRGDPKGAVDDFRAGLTLKEKVFPPDHHEIAISLAAIGAALTEAGDHEAALPPTNRAIDIYQRAYGRDSPLLAYVFGNRGEILGALGRHAEAERDLRESLARWIVQTGPEHHWTAHALTALGATLLAQGRGLEARDVLERALRIRERSEPSVERVAQTRFLLARALWDVGERARSKALAREARDTYHKASATKEAAQQISAWLDDRYAAARSR